MLRICVHIRVLLDACTEAQADVSQPTPRCSLISSRADPAAWLLPSFADHKKLCSLTAADAFMAAFITSTIHPPLNKLIFGGTGHRLQASLPGLQSNGGMRWIWSTLPSQPSFRTANQSAPEGHWCVVRTNQSPFTCYPSQRPCSCNPSSHIRSDCI
jgi:hypothetical protein